MRTPKAAAFHLVLAAGTTLATSTLAQQPAPPAPPAEPAAPPAPVEAAPAPEPPPSAPAATVAPAAEPAPAAPAGAAPEAAPVEAAPAAPAEEAEAPPPPPAINGYVEAAYHANFRNLRYHAAVPLHSYDGISGNSFYFHAAHLVLTHSFSEDVGLTAELDMGTDAIATNATYAATHSSGVYPSPLPFDFQEAYVSWSPGDFTLTAGKFVTYQGIEVIEGPLNPTLTRGFLFGLAEPFSHTGVKAHYAIGDELNIGAGVVNGWDTIIDNNDGKTIIFAVKVTPVDAFFAQASGTFGPEQIGVDGKRRLSLDLTGGVVVDPGTIYFQANYGSEQDVVVSPADPGDPTAVPPIPPTAAVLKDDSWIGFGVQPFFPIDKFSIGGRFEWFKNKEGSRTLTPNVGYMNVSLTPGFTPSEGFTIRAEFRADLASEKVFPNPKGEGGKTQMTAGVGAHYIF